RQADLIRGAKHAATVEVDGEIADPELSGLGGVRVEDAAERDANPRQELLGAEGLGHVVIRPLVEGRDLVDLGAPGRQNDDRHERLPADAPTDLAPVDVGQPEVEDDQVRRGSFPRLESLSTAPGAFDLEAAGCEEGRQTALN